MMKKIYVIIPMVLYVILLSSLVSATIVSFQPDAVNGTDTYVHAGVPDSTFGAGLNFRWAGDGGGSEMRSLLNFNFTCDSLPSSFTANNVTLRLWAEQLPGSQLANVYPMTETWAESTLTWNTCGSGCTGKWNTSWQIALSTTPITNGNYFNISLNTTWYEANCANEEKQWGFIIEKGATSGTEIYASSSDYTTAAYRPELIVDYGLAEGEISTPVFSPPTPDDDAVVNSNQTINCTHNGTDIKYYFFVDEIAYFYNVSESGPGYFNWTTNFTDGTYEYSCMVQNVTAGGSGYSDNVTRTLTIDTTDPVIILNGGNSFNSSDVSTTNQYADYLYINITVTDETELNNFLINVTLDGFPYFNITNTTLNGLLIYNFTKNISTSTWPAGVYDINVTVSDAHTASTIRDYGISQFINRITFRTEEGNEISISGGGAYSTKYNRKKDRYEFGFDYLLKNTERAFTIRADNEIKYLPNSNYAAHFVVWNPATKTGNWIDFEGIGDDYSVRKISDREYEITFINLPESKEIIAKSIGGVNVVTQNYKWYKGNYTTTAPTITKFGNSETFILNISSNPDYLAINASFYYNNTFYTHTKVVGNNYTSFLSAIVIPKITESSENKTFYWEVDVNQSNGNKYSFNIENTLNISNAGIDNCTIYNKTVLRIFGKDEETDEDVNTTLNIFLEVVSLIGGNSSYELSGQINYSFCANKNFTIDSIMEFGDGVIYTNKKYYLNNLVLNTEVIQNVFLYHLNNTKASEIVFTVFDTTTGDKVDGAFIEILRYYPGENVFRVVEIAKTDEIGQSLGKMVLADVFYKFIIEKPAGTVKLDTGILRVLSLTRSFGISFVVDVLDTWDKIHGVSTSITCTKGTQTCRLTWSDSSNIVRDATLEVWSTTGLTDNLLSSQTTVAAAGTISYTIVEDTTGKNYIAKGFIESNTGTSLYGVGIAGLIFSDNPFFTDEAHRIASLFPLLLLVLVIIFALIDFGCIGITIGALLGLIIGSITGILPIDPFYLISFILMAILLIYKLSK